MTPPRPKSGWRLPHVTEGFCRALAAPPWPKPARCCRLRCRCPASASAARACRSLRLLPSRPGTLHSHPFTPPRPKPLLPSLPVCGTVWNPCSQRPKPPPASVPHGWPILAPRRFPKAAPRRSSRPWPTHPRPSPLARLQLSGSSTYVTLNPPPAPLDVAASSNHQARFLTDSLRRLRPLARGWRVRLLFDCLSLFERSPSECDLERPRLFGIPPLTMGRNFLDATPSRGRR